VGAVVKESRFRSITLTLSGKSGRASIAWVEKRDEELQKKNKDLLLRILWGSFTFASLIAIRADSD
jgi:hypothetical protein